MFPSPRYRHTRAAHTRRRIRSAALRLSCCPPVVRVRPVPPWHGDRSERSCRARVLSSATCGPRTDKKRARGARPCGTGYCPFSTIPLETLCTGGALAAPLPRSLAPWRRQLAAPWRRPFPDPWRRPSPDPWRRPSPDPWRPGGALADPSKTRKVPVAPMHRSAATWQAHNMAQTQRGASTTGVARAQQAWRQHHRCGMDATGVAAAQQVWRGRDGGRGRGRPFSLNGENLAWK
jgi:hypothetical protein